MQFLWENRLNGCQILGWFGFEKPNPNQISVFRTSLIHKKNCYAIHHNNK